MKSRYSRALVVLVVGLLIIPGAVFAQTNTSSLQAQIAALLAQIQALQAQLAAQQGGQSNCVDIPSPLTLGSSGYEVHQLQAYLIKNGFLSSQYNTGYYGFLTAQAVGRLQMNRGIVTSTSDSSYGIMSADTRSAIACSNTSHNTPAPTLPSNTSPLSVSCSGAGYNSGTPGVNWHAYASGGSGGYSYRWTLSDDINSYGEGSVYGSGVMVTYRSSGVKHATVTVGDGVNNLQVSCSTSTGDGTSTTGKASVSIDSSSLSTTSSHPTITGTAQNVSTIGISVSEGGGKYDGTGTFSVVNGHWSVTLNNSAYPPDTYGLDVYDGNNNFLTHANLVVRPTGNSSINVIESSYSYPSTVITVQYASMPVASVRIIDSKGKTVWTQSLNDSGKTDGTTDITYAGTLPVGYYTVQAYSYSNGSVFATSKQFLFDFNSSLSICPATAQSQRGQNGTQFQCMCLGNASAKPVWGGGGNGQYFTDDSDICTAGAMIGQMNLTTGGEVDYTIEPSQNSYSAFTSPYGLTSQSWGVWGGSFAITGPKG